MQIPDLQVELDSAKDVNVCSQQTIYDLNSRRRRGLIMLAAALAVVLPFSANIYYPALAVSEANTLGCAMP
jgi:hypothetical protein